MSAISCVIRFTDHERTTFAYVGRDNNGHPEEIVSNLDGLQEIITKKEKLPEPENMAFQFLVTDALHYLFFAISPDELEDMLWWLVTHPRRLDADVFSSLQHHRVISELSAIEDISFLYEVAIGGSEESEWHISISHVKDDTSNLEGLYETGSWDFTGDLSMAKDQFN